MDIKIFNFGLPRTGTTSFHNFLLNNNVTSLHSNKDEIDKIYPTEYFKYLEDKPSLINIYLDKYSAFSDCPWYSLAEKIVSNYYQNKYAHFVATFRSDNKWVKSFLSINSALFKSEANTLYHKYVYGDLIKNKDFTKLTDFYNKFYHNLQHIEKKYNIKIHILDLSHTDKIVEIMKTIVPIYNTTYPHNNKSRL